MLILSPFYPLFFHNYDIDVKPNLFHSFSQLFHTNDRQAKPLFAQRIPIFSFNFSALLTKSIVIFPQEKVLQIFPSIKSIVDFSLKKKYCSFSFKKKYCSFSLKFSKLSTKKLQHFPSSFSSYLTESIPTLYLLLTKSIPLFSLKFSTLFNKKHRTFFSQIFKVINKRYLTFPTKITEFLTKTFLNWTATPNLSPKKRVDQHH